MAFIDSQMAEETTKNAAGEMEMTCEDPVFSSFALMLMSQLSRR